MIIAFMGEYKSGKDYFCEYLEEKYNAHRLSFSDEVRRLSVQMFPWLPLHVDPEYKDKPFMHEKNPHGLTPRDIWLLAGKVRDVTPTYFVDAFYRYQYHSIDPTKLNIITDFRTADEWDFIQREKIPVIKIEREDRTGLIPNAFEEFLRRFKEYDALFTNKMNGTEEFDKFFKEFLNGL